MRFIDLFAGLGGFHLALKRLEHECVFACEIDKQMAELYEQNYGIKPQGDIKKVDIKNIPPHDILCGGFPCQPFSKAGKMLGRNHHNDLGVLFDEIIKILAYHKPTFFILENVPFIAKHDNESMWKHIKSEFKRIGYTSDEKVYSPHQFGIPQHRQRIYIVGCRKGLKHFNWVELESQKNYNTDIRDILDTNPVDCKKIDKAESKCLDLWQEFINSIPSNVQIPKFPIWGMEFGATYPIEDGKVPAKLTANELGKYKGVFGISLKGLTKEEQYKLLPSHAINTEDNFPAWKKRYIQLSRDFYEEHKKKLKKAVSKISKLPISSWHKLEWNVGDGERNIRNYIIQFRASGIRLKKTESSPSLVCTNTQIPIIGWENRYITKLEGARLQCMDNIILPENYSTCFKALGNAVNVEIVYQIGKNLLDSKLCENPKLNLKYKSQPKSLIKKIS